MPAPNPFANLPSISFANTDVTAMTNAFITGWQSAWLADTGETVTLSPADRRYHFILSFMGFFIAAFEQLDAAMKQDLLPFATGGFLDNITSIFGPRAARLQPTGAECPLQFTVPVSTSVSVIPQGTIVGDASGTGLQFTTNSILQILPGQTTGTVNATCSTTGPIGNGLPANTITTLIGWSNPSFTPTVTNTQVTVGGSDIETDDAMRVRIFGVTDSYSNAGSYGAYQFFAQSADPSISQVSVSGPEDGLAPGNVLVTVLCQNGAFPNTSILNKVAAAVNADTVRDLCANVAVSAPTGVPFNVSVSYWIPNANANNVSNIQANVNSAVQGFIVNTTNTIGQDIDPSQLTAAMVNAGAIHVAVSQPTFSALSKSKIGTFSGSGYGTVTYLGLT